MSLRSRLARLPEGAVGASGVASASVPAPSRVPHERVPSERHGPSETQEERAPSTSLLDDLRARMDAILRRPSEAPAPPARADLPELPFAVEETPEGPLHVRTLRLSGAHRVGRVPVTTARTARAELLAVLSLDPNLATCLPSGALYLDTETTGLGPGAGTVAFLVGLAFWDDEAGLVVEQLLVRSLGEEAPVLARVRERIRRASMLVTFNGKSFDMPVLRTRFVMARMTPPVEPPHLDLLHVVRRLHKHRGFGSRLGAVERSVLGFVREGDVPSGEVSACYLHFLRTGDPRALVGVVDHNAWDVVSMAALVALYGESIEGSELEAADLAAVARTWKRAAGVWERSTAELGTSETASEDVARAMVSRAYDIADLAHARGGGNDAIRARAEIAKARGDKVRALADFESLASQIDDPSVRLELVKLYEHHKKDWARALEVAALGTSEETPNRERRAQRLQKKLEKAGASRAKQNLKLW